MNFKKNLAAAMACVIGAGAFAALPIANASAAYVSPVAISTEKTASGAFELEAGGAKPGDTVTLKVTADTSVTFSGVQFKVSVDSPLEFVGVANETNEFGMKVECNPETGEIAFADAIGNEVGIDTLVEKATVIADLVFKVPDDCEGGGYGVTLSDWFVSGNDGEEITSNYDYPTTRYILVAEETPGPVSGGTAIEYSEGSDAVEVGDNGVSLRKNIYNVWGNEVTDIDGNTAVDNYVKVVFELSGIGEDSANITYGDDGTITSEEPFYAYLGGSIAGQSRHQSNYDSGDIPDDEITALNGDGEYEVIWNLDWGSENIDCLYVQTNINVYAYGESKETSTAKITIKSITTGIEAAAGKLGDANLDDAVDAKDASAVLAEYARLSTSKPSEFNEQQNINSDVNFDGTVDAKDSSLILAFYSFLSTGGSGTMEDWLDSRTAE